MQDNVKLILFYCTTPLGVLEKSNNGYVYTSNIKNEQRLSEEHLLISSDYNLYNSFKRESRKLFPEFERFIEQTRKDILERAGILPEDSQWDILVKLSQRPTFPSGFYVQQRI